MQTAYSYTTYNPVTDDGNAAPLGFATSHHRRRRSPHRGPVKQRTAPVSPRRKHGQALHWNPSVAFVCGVIFLQIMIYIFLNAAALATAFYGRQLDNRISEVQNTLHRDYSRIAVITSPDQARKIAQVKGLQKVTPDMIDDLTRAPNSRLAAKPADSYPEVPTAHPVRVKTGSQTNRNSQKPVQFVLLP